VRWTRELVPFCLLVCCVGGCIVIPDTTARDPSRLIGDGPNAQLRIGSATREHVLAVLGPPDFRSQHDLAFGYVNSVHTGKAYGVLLGPCCNPYLGKTDVYTYDDVWVEFDPRGVLKRYAKQLIAKCDDSDYGAWRKFMETVPDTRRPSEMLPDERSADSR
jgi:outer membrane protein assembly factor BamE (lipoprotein component of BamABCDE complex)